MGLSTNEIGVLHYWVLSPSGGPGQGGRHSQLDVELIMRMLYQLTHGSHHVCCHHPG